MMHINVGNVRLHIYYRKNDTLYKISKDRYIRKETHIKIYKNI